MGRGKNGMERAQKEEEEDVEVKNVQCAYLSPRNEPFLLPFLCLVQSPLRPSLFTSEATQCRQPRPGHIPDLEEGLAAPAGSAMALSNGREGW